MTAEPLRPPVVETVFYEPDQAAVIAVLPGGLWLAPGDIVEFDEPARDARVLSTRLQVRRGEARVLIVLDVIDDPGDVLRGDTPTDVALGADVDESRSTSARLDDELGRLTDEVDIESPTRET